ncbi:hypothetical protein [Lysinibacter cavernae]|uniref:MmpS family membrane protein n=1 Tax=Lysinibacter cavernae TaxID=1640652 RepID=A0A7X5R3K4_9MICO|nr:hypothetical protein [Lysinibacter cavernae]NIH54752.1 hypothetical protein [Lysinibacter cavernae]
MNTSRSRNSFALYLAAAGSAGVLAAMLTGCSSDPSRGEARTVTYEVTVTGENVSELTDVSYEGTPTGGSVADKLERRDADGTISTVGAKNSEVWQAKALVGPNSTAEIRVTPPAGSTVKCRIIEDGDTELGSHSGQPGQPVLCSVKTLPVE